MKQVYPVKIPERVFEAGVFRAVVVDTTCDDWRLVFRNGSEMVNIVVTEEDLRNLARETAPWRP